MLSRNIIPINSTIRDYCIKLSTESIKKISEKYNRENKQAINLKINNQCLVAKEEYDISNPSYCAKIIYPPNINPKNNIFLFYIICFLSTSSILCYVYNTLHTNMFSFNRYIDVSKP